MSYFELNPHGQAGSAKPWKKARGISHNANMHRIVAKMEELQDKEYQLGSILHRPWKFKSRNELRNFTMTLTWHEF